MTDNVTPFPRAPKDPTAALRARRIRRKRKDAATAAGLKPSPIPKLERMRSQWRHPLNTVWEGMIRRCYDTGDANYGGKGISICDRWLYGDGNKTGFECFLGDMGPRPSPKHTIDRWPNRRGNYEPPNCRWATRKEQGSNKINNVELEINGRIQTKAQWCDEIGWSGAKFHHRVSQMKTTACPL
jgi:hypothetical protein